LAIKIKKREIMSHSTIAYLEANHQKILNELIAFASIPSVSTDPQCRESLENAAHWVANALTDAGPFDVSILPTTGNPIVYAQWLGVPGAPTLLIYGHYDVQPPDPLEKWDTPPFEPTIRNERLYARGVSDDKGPIFIPIKVAQAYFATNGALPVNVKFLIEGEEEIGSPSLADFVQKNAQMLKADFVLSADGAMWRIDRPFVNIASRGIASIEFSITGPQKDLHSGRHGGGVANPLHAVAALVASLHTSDGKVAVPDFYDGVVELSPEERTAIAALPFDEQDYLDSIGIPSSFGEPGYNLLERQWTRPTLEINGMWGGYEGPGSKTVIPSSAHAKISCRLVPFQNPQEVLRRIVEHLQANVQTGVTLTIHPDQEGIPAYCVPMDHIGLKICRDVLREIYKAEPLSVRTGSSLPISSTFKQVLGLDTIFFSFSTADEDFHAPNEFFRIQRLFDGLKAWALYWDKVSSLSSY
jgi:acetylornithine deacetylase/succinyl-diaminopimelate desuccinylase-like protein